MSLDDAGMTGKRVCALPSRRSLRTWRRTPRAPYRRTRNVTQPSNDFFTLSWSSRKRPGSPTGLPPPWCCQGPARAAKALSRTSRSALLTRNLVALLLPALTALVFSRPCGVGFARLATCRSLHPDHDQEENQSDRRDDAILTSGAPSGMTRAKGHLHVINQPGQQSYRTQHPRPAPGVMQREGSGGAPGTRVRGRCLV